MDLFDIVANRPIEEDPDSAATCPVCATADVDKVESWTTLLGGGPRINHVWTTYFCGHGHSFVRETKGDNTWYTQDQKVLLGMPSCFETYIYTCSKCAGPVRQTITDKDDTTREVHVRSYSYEGEGSERKQIRHFRIFFYCDDCHHGGEVAEEYWRG